MNNSGGVLTSCSASSSSASGLLSLLDEKEEPLRSYALRQINCVVDSFWAEISEYLSDIEQLSEDSKFRDNKLAALVASKVYFHLEEYSEAARFALKAGELLDLNDKSPFVQTVLSRCIDEYVALRANKEEESNTNLGVSAIDQNTKATTIDPQLENVIDRMFEHCIEDEEFNQAIGIALECRRLDHLKKIIKAAPDPITIVQYCLTNAQSVVSSKKFRLQVLELLVSVYRGLDSDKLTGELPNLCQCLFFLNDVESVFAILMDLIRSEDDEKKLLLAFQIAFDLVTNENQQFLGSLLASIPQPATSVVATAVETTVDTAAVVIEETVDSTATDVEQLRAPLLVVNSANVPPAAESIAESRYNKAILRLRYILEGSAPIDLHLLFLSQKNKADLHLLEHIKSSVDQRNSITHNAIVLAHGIMHAGTTEDEFLRKNLDWLGKAVSWAKFTATASLGVIHRGHFSNSMKVLEPYLPQSSTQSGGYSEGGALYALGLIHANHSDDTVRKYLLEQLRGSSQNEQIQNGACLGLGLLCMGSRDEELYEELKAVLLTDGAIAGEAAGYAIGLVMMGSASEYVISELLAYAHDTQHEKIIRACAVALALLMFEMEEDAEVLIQQLLIDKDPILRYGAMFIIAMAYCGSCSNTAVKRLLHFSVSDVSDDVRRAAVIAIGFVMCNAPDQVPKVVSLLCESYNSHVRYASCIALGLSCAGTASKEAVNLLMPMTSDNADPVRQGAFMALGMILQQSTDALNDKTKVVRDLLIKILSDDHEDVMARFGAILASGLIDAGGRNAVISFYSRAGALRAEAAVGMLMFCQLWYWYPLIHIISLALQPTALIGMTVDLKMPSSFAVRSMASEHMFAYPATFEVKKDEVPTRTATAVLSTAAKKGLKMKQSSMKLTASESKDGDLEEPLKTATGTDEDTASVPSTRGGIDAASTAATAGGEDVNTEIGSIMSDARSLAARSDRRDDTASKGNDSKANKSVDETAGGSKTSVVGEEEESASSVLLSNPCRVLPRQEVCIEIISEARYQPVINGRKSGFLLLLDNMPNEAETYVQPKSPNDDDGEPDVPPAFEFSA